jgi:hypothetical protein
MQTDLFDVNAVNLDIAFFDFKYPKQTKSQATLASTCSSNYTDLKKYLY